MNAGVIVATIFGILWVIVVAGIVICDIRNPDDKA